MKVLIIDDEVEILNKISFLAEAEGFTVKTVQNISGLQAFLKARLFYPHVVVLDRLLQGTDSVYSIPLIRSTFAETKIIVVSAIDTPMEKARALDVGADDYLAKPFSSIELMARLKALCRRKEISASPLIELGNLSVDPVLRVVKVNGQQMSMSVREYQLLSLFCESPGKVFPREVLLTKIWDSKSESETKVVEATINNLRRKLEFHAATVVIKNVRNVGYWLEA